MSTSSTDGAKGSAMAAIEAAERALDRELIDAGGAETASSEVEATVAAARAAARAAMDSLRTGGVVGGSGSRYQEGALEDEEGFFASQQAIVSPARAAVEAALAAVAGEEEEEAKGKEAARAGIRIVEAVLARRDAGAAEVEIAETSTAAAVGAEEASAGRGPGDDGPGDEEDFSVEKPTREPASASRTRNSPVASHSHLAHLLWEQVAGPGDIAVDCTAGNGHDSLALGRIVGLKDGLGKLYCIDIQESALEATRGRLSTELGDTAVERTAFIRGNFRDMPPELEPKSVQLVAYNLGWLPGGDKSITTELRDTLESIEGARRLVKSGGMVSVMCYRGHEEGLRETTALLEYAQGLTHFLWRVYVHERTNRPGSPLLITMYRL